MPVLSLIKENYEKEKPFAGKTIGMALHVEPKTAYLVRTLEAGGAKVHITGCNPLSTQDDAADALRAAGTDCLAKHGQSNEEYYEAMNKIADKKPDVIIDDGGDFIKLIHTERTELIDTIAGACEETTTGITRLQAMEKDGALKIPVIDVNDADSKHLFDNYYGTGESTLTAIMITTNSMISGKNFVVGGYGYCGQGIANKAKGFGANVIVTEINPVRALKAKLDGFTVLPMAEAAKRADFIVTATGMKDVVAGAALKNLKNNCILANSGHFDIEINQNELAQLAKKREIDQDIDEYTFPDGRKAYVLAKGRLVNLAASKGLGHPMEVMDMSFALQALCTKYVLENKLDPKVLPVPKDIDQEVSRLKLEAMDTTIDQLSAEQQRYGSSWEEGT